MRAQERGRSMRPMLLSRQARTQSTLGRNPSSSPEGDRKIIRLCPGRGAVRSHPAPMRWDAIGDSPVANLERYESGSESEEVYRQRMVCNLVAAIVLIALIITGNWIVETLAQTTREGRNIARTVQDTSAPAFIWR